MFHSVPIFSSTNDTIFFVLVSKCVTHTYIYIFVMCICTYNVYIHILYIYIYTYNVYIYTYNVYIYNVYNIYIMYIYIYILAPHVFRCQFSYFPYISFGGEDSSRVSPRPWECTSGVSNNSSGEELGLIPSVKHTKNYCHRIGWWENLQESPIFDGKNHGFL